ncbi:TetR family transcriptional regulator [Halanaerobium saccharolyticum]|jgi:AcrR family transcriptional regulator|uniref:TetR family transcriptional regulator n=1 Tax=Halanaerobium saccharolyticum TaxID=43595 RepID=A0A2T5RG35_9FIRM|nr:MULTISPECIES: TetR/AcrR family transcriptional regulator [Halanaerobium]PTV93385.1 TetR family transcriptional regulator [Halanaerobium saccharolyticum]PUU95242.1 MAG: TetR family transcriptional regulator [Halanaerobium sp.]
MAKDTREEILEAALNMFSINNYHATSMSMIAEEAGVSKGTLYWHFDSKEDLFRELVLAGFDYFNENYKKIQSEKLNAKEKLHEIIYFSIKMLSENLKMGNILQNNIQLISSEFQKKMIERHKSAIKVIKLVIEQGIEEETIKTDNPHNTAVMILTLIFNTHSQELYYNFETIKEDVDFIYNFIMQGISKEA